MKIVKKGGASDTFLGVIFYQIHVGGTPLGRNAKNASPPTSPTLRIYNGLTEPTFSVGGQRGAPSFFMGGQARPPCPAPQEAIVEGGGGLGGRGGIHGLPDRQTECMRMICNSIQRSAQATPLAHRMSLKLLLSAAPFASLCMYPLQQLTHRGPNHNSLF